MLVEPSVFIESAFAIGCTHQEFLSCADHVTEQIDVLLHLSAMGQSVYYKLDYPNRLLTVVTAGCKTVEATNDEYAELFSTIRHISH
jgi:hypothetical protein